jgi:hypothetical protein
MSSLNIRYPDSEGEERQGLVAGLLTASQRSNNILQNGHESGGRMIIADDAAGKDDDEFIDLTYEADSEAESIEGGGDADIARPSDQPILISPGEEPATSFLQTYSDVFDKDSTELFLTNKRIRESRSTEESSDIAPAQKRVRFDHGLEHGRRAIFKNRYQALAPRILCMHRSSAVVDLNGLSQFVPDSQSQGPCITEYHKGYGGVEDGEGTPFAVVVSRDCVGFKVLLSRLAIGRCASFLKGFK